MTRDSDFLVLIEDYLDEYEGDTPLPDLMRNGIRASLSTTSQRPAWWPGWRFPAMTTTTRIGLAAVVLGFVLIAGLTYLARPAVGDPTPTIEARLTENGLIAVVGDRDYQLDGAAPMNSDIYLVEADGGSLRQVTDTPDSEFSPVFSPDGSRLAFLRGWSCDCQPGVATSVVVVDATTGTDLFVSEVPQGYAINLEWSPDGQSIMAHWQGGEGGWSTSAVDLATGTWRDLAFGLAARVAWSPDGRWLLATTGDLFAIPADAVSAGPVDDPATVPGVRQLTDDTTNESAGSWAPDGQSVLFVSHTSDGTAVMIVGLEVGEPSILAADGFSPAWSPDGARVSYLRVEGPRFSPETVFDPEGAEVWIVDADGTSAQTVASSFTPARWSPDSELLYLFGSEGITTVDADNSELRLALMPPEFWPASSDIAWLSALEQYDGAYGHRGGADWQPTR